VLAIYIISAFIIIGLMFFIFRTGYNKGWRKRGIQDNKEIEYYREMSNLQLKQRRDAAHRSFQNIKRLLNENESLNLMCAEKDNWIDSLNESIRQKNLAIENLKIWNFPPPKNQLFITAENLIEDSAYIQNKEVANG
jgi:hypothetical protein